MNAKGRGLISSAASWVVTLVLFSGCNTGDGDSRTEKGAVNLPAVAETSYVAKPPPQAEAGFDVLRGRWVRPDGGYTISIENVEPVGKLDAMYANPTPLPFAKAEASRDGNSIKLFFELTAGGYNGSTYTLMYDPATDVLKGVYYQAIAQQKFDIYFERAKP